MNTRLELALRERHQNADDGLKAVKVSLIYNGLLQHAQAFVIKAMTRFSKQLHSMWFEHTVGVKMHEAWFIKQCGDFYSEHFTNNM